MAKCGAPRCWTSCSDGEGLARQTRAIRSGRGRRSTHSNARLPRCGRVSGCGRARRSGTGSGALAAAQAAGVFSLEDGLRLAATLDGLGAAPDDIALGAPDVDAGRHRVGARRIARRCPGRGLLAPAGGGRAGILRELRRNAGGGGYRRGYRDRSGHGVGDEADGSVAGYDRECRRAGRPVEPWALARLARQTPEAQPNGGPNGGFADAVAGAYEAGLAVSFAGLFAGETRRRVSLPDYPFERTRYWI